MSKRTPSTKLIKVRRKPHPGRHRLEILVNADAGLTLCDIDVSELLSPYAFTLIGSIRQKLMGEEWVGYSIDVPESSCHLSAKTLCSQTEERLCHRVFRRHGWRLDGSPMPNISTKIIRDLMYRSDATSRQLLSEIHKTFEKQWPLFDRDLKSPVLYGKPEWVEVDGRLVNSIEAHAKEAKSRRAHVLTWIETYFSDGLGAAEDYGKS